MVAAHPNRRLSTAMRRILYSLCFAVGCADRVASIQAGVRPCQSQMDCSGEHICFKGRCLLRICDNDGVPELGEACDDGNGIATDGCRPNCQLARCGDGIVRTDRAVDDPGFEACDDGNQQADDDCLNDCSLARCGDGLRRLDLAEGQDGYEACDDGNSSETDDCLSDCTRPRCGDGRLREGLLVGDPGYEACDDGNEDNSDDCVSGCVEARCGDGYRRLDRIVDEPGYEACDDGNDQEEDACKNDCRLNRCGDGIHHVGVELCDDGNEDGGDDCTLDCQPARCGDGVLWLGVEACDDGNEVDADGCKNDCSVADCGDGVVRRDLLAMTEAGFESCEPDVHTGPRHCQANCRLGPRSRLLTGGYDWMALNHERAAWIWGRIRTRLWRDSAVPLEVDVGAGNVLHLGQGSQSLCVLYDGLVSYCHPAFNYWLPTGIPSDEAVLDVNFEAGGEANHCYLSTKGLIKCWSPVYPLPTAVSGLFNVVTYAKRGNQGCAVDVAGEVWCWIDGQEAERVDDRGDGVEVFLSQMQDVLGEGDRLRWTEPQGRHMLRGDGTVTNLVSGEDIRGIPEPVVRFATNCRSTACAVTDSGALYCSSNDRFNRVFPRPEGELTETDEFIHIPVDEPVVELALGCENGAVLTESGQVLGWGAIWEVDEDGNFPHYWQYQYSRSPNPVIGLPQVDEP